MKAELMALREFEKDEVFACISGLIKSAGQIDDGYKQEAVSWYCDSVCRMAEAAEKYLNVDAADSPDQQLEKVVYGRFIDPAARKKIYCEIEKIVSDEAILIMPIRLVSNMVASKKVQNVPRPTGNIAHIHGVWLDDSRK